MAPFRRKAWWWQPAVALRRTEGKGLGGFSASLTASRGVSVTLLTLTLLAVCYRVLLLFTHTSQDGTIQQVD